MNFLSPSIHRRRFTQSLLSGCALLYGVRSGMGSIGSPPLSGSSLVMANNTFAFSLLREVAGKKREDNQFFSPYSLESALSIALEGARGLTAQQMGATLGYPNSIHVGGEQPWKMELLRKEFASLAKQMEPPKSDSQKKIHEEILILRKKLQETNASAKKLAKSNKYVEANKNQEQAEQLAIRINTLTRTVDQFELQSANSLWLDQSYPLSTIFQKNVETFYGSAGTFACDFRGNPDVQRQRINEWVSQQTHDRIQNIIPPKALDELTRLVIANAIYFRGTWASPFQESSTKNVPFLLRGGSKATVPMMMAMKFQAGRYAAFEKDGTKFETPFDVEKNFQEKNGYPKDGFQVVELPYNGDRLSMLAILPIRPDGIDDLVGWLTEEHLGNALQGLDMREFHLKLPKFQLSSNYDLKAPLQAMGMIEAFDSRTADFQGLTESLSPEHRLYISLVLHKAFVDVNEKGTEAAAATIVGFAPLSAAPSQLRPFTPTFQADHPFLMAIIERETGMILFLGKVEKPT